MSDEGNPQGAGQMQELTQLQSSILMAFNLGVSYNQQSGGLKSITEVSGELGHNIYTNLSQVYGNKLEDDYLRANTEYFLQIALLGYIIPSVCAYEEDFKNKLLSLIERRALKTQEQMSGQGGPSGGGSIVTP
ncbi:MAG TPA: hypothetical protein PKC29_06475 [Thermodesulfobacteriota bacterium]|nr:hypothetical protein [Thermodesulfobacteriota bacterium]